MWVGQNIAQVWRHAISQGGGADDYTTLIKYMEDWGRRASARQEPEVIAIGDTRHD